MFSGIVEEVGIVKSGRPNSLTVQAHRALEGVHMGDSISIGGACLTVMALQEGAFSVDLSPETLSRTNLGDLQAGNRVNLERAIALGQRLGGHLVQGHVDATGEVLSVEPQEGNCLLIRISAPPSVMHYVVENGFVSMEGVSLTVVKRDASSFSVSVIPYTLQNTVMGKRKVGDLVNLEVDILSKYVERLHKPIDTAR